MKLTYSRVETRLPAGEFKFKPYLWLAGKIKIPFSTGEYLDVYTIDGEVKLKTIKKLLKIDATKRILMIFNEGTKWQYVVQYRYRNSRFVRLNYKKFITYGKAEYVYY